MHWPPAKIESIYIDIRFALRQLRQSPGFAITAILTLAVGMAAAIAIFAFVDSALIRPLPYPNLPRLMGVFETSPLAGLRCHYSYPNYLDLERSNTVFSSLGAYNADVGYLLADGRSAQLVNGTGVTGNFFRVLGVTPILGRDFEAKPANEDLVGTPSTVILSYAAWQSRFGGRSDVLGKSVTLNNEPYSIIGVLPERFQFAPTGVTEFWTTLHSFAGDSCSIHRGCMMMGVVARLKDGVSMRQALTNVQAIAAEESSKHPDPDRNRGANLFPLSEAILGDIRPILLALLSGAGLLLLIAYVNVTGLLLLRSEHRRREFAVRGALGAARTRLLRQFITEGLVIVAVSSLLALSLASLARRTLLSLIPSDMLANMPYLYTSGSNLHLLLITILLILIACTLFAFTPAVRLTFADLRGGLSEGSRSVAGTIWRRLGSRLVVFELAMTMILLAGAALLGKSLYLLMHSDLGFVPSHLATLHVGAPSKRYNNEEQFIALQKQIVSRLGNIAGVSAVGTTNSLPVGGDSLTQIGIIGQPASGENNEAGHRSISAEYLSVLQARLLNGRYFTAHDNPHSPMVAIVNQTLARLYLPNQNPVGVEVYWHGRPQNHIQIVGLIADVKEDSLDERPTPFIYTPFDQGPSSDFSLAVRTFPRAESVLPSLVAAITNIDPNIITSDTVTMSDLIQSSTAASLHRASAWVASSFAALALLLSIVGLYGVVSYSVSQRTREIGVRMALGARTSSVYRLILTEAGRLTLIGLILGLSGSILAGVLMRSLLFGVRSWDASILLAVAAVLVASALLATHIPARRAASVNPVEALRAE